MAPSKRWEAWSAGFAKRVDAKADDAPGWDEFFRDDLGGPDLRIVDD